MNKFNQTLNESVVQSNKYYAIKLKYCLNRLIQSSHHQSNADLINVLAEIKSTDLINKGNTFLWLNTHRLYSSDVNQDFELYDSNVEYLLVSAFDCYFDKLPIGITLLINDFNDDNFYFPYLGVKFPNSGDAAMIKKIGDSEFQIETNLGAERIHIGSISLASQFRVDQLSDSSKVVHDGGISIFEDLFFDEVTCDPSYCTGIKDSIESALHTIYLVDSGLYRDILGRVKWFVPIGKPERNRYYSFTSAMMKDTIFLSLQRKGMLLVEDLVHEYSHIKLSYFMDTQLIFERDYSNRYYSPWKRGARPLAALIHAVYVFSTCIEFYRKYLIVYPNLESSFEVMVRSNELHHMVTIGLSQIPAQELTENGHQLVKYIKNVLKGNIREPWVNSTAPKPVVDHFQEWAHDKERYVPIAL